MRLKDKVAIITGAGSGIGRATAALFVKEGAKVVVADIDSEGGKTTASTIREKGGEAIFVNADISKEGEAHKIADEAVKSFGRIDILVNDAATFVLKGLEATEEDWRSSLGVNVIGTALCSKYAVEHMKKAGGGAIVNLGSISSFVAQPNFLTYSATKAALVQMTRNMAMDLAPFNIRVNCVCPGAILTPASYRHMQQARITLEQFLAEVSSSNFLRRIGEPHEVACAILFLASDEASYITGTYLLVDGGYTAQ